MSFFETCVKLAAYLICIGVALEFSHRLYWRVSSGVMALEVSTFARSALSALAACIPLATALGVTLVFTAILDQGSLTTLGLKYDAESLTHVAYGAGVAFGCVTLVFLIGVVSGYIHVRPSRMSEDCVSCLPMFFGGLADFFTSAVFEEIITRGYIFYLLYQTWDASTAIVGSAVIFSFAHMLKHSGTPALFTINAFVFGLLTAACRHYTGTLWLPIGLHFGWNVAAGPIFGLPFSGKTYDRGVVVSEVSGPLWLTGGYYSLDAGVLGSAALLVAALGLTAVVPVM